MLNKGTKLIKIKQIMMFFSWKSNFQYPKNVFVIRLFHLEYANARLLFFAM